MARMTYEELKSKLDTLSPEQLAQPAQVLGCERPGPGICGVDVMEEDYVDSGCDGAEPASVYPDDNFPVVIAKGTVLLIEDA